MNLNTGTTKVRRGLYATLGVFSVALGIIGVFVEWALSERCAERLEIEHALPLFAGESILTPAERIRRTAGQRPSHRQQDRARQGLRSRPR